MSWEIGERKKQRKLERKEGRLFFQFLTEDLSASLWPSLDQAWIRGGGGRRREGGEEGGRERERGRKDKGRLGETAGRLRPGGGRG